jgi:hypothetical protein
MPSDRFSLARRGFFVGLAAVFLPILAYIGFISAVSIWTGLAAADRYGFWVPIGAGFLVLLGVVWVFFTIVTAAFRKEKEDVWVEI